MSSLVATESPDSAVCDALSKPQIILVRRTQSKRAFAMVNEVKALV